MGFVNAVKIALSKISVAFKVLFYDIIIGGIIVAICAGVLAPQFEVMVEALDGSTSHFVASFLDYISGNSSALTTYFDDLGKVFQAISTNFDIAFIVVLGMSLVLRFLINLRNIPVCDIVDFHMTEGSNHYFLSNYIRNIGRSAKYSLLRLVLSIPFDAVILVTIYFVVGQLFVWLGFAAPFVIILFLVAIFALRQTVFYFWLPLIVKGKPIMRAFGESFKLAFSRFGEIFIAMFSYNILWVALVVLASISTYFVGLLLVVPLLSVLMCAMQLIKFHNINKMRYFADDNEVIEPSIVEDVEIEDKEQDYENDEVSVVGGNN